VEEEEEEMASLIWQTAFQSERKEGEEEEGDWTTPDCKSELIKLSRDFTGSIQHLQLCF